jgi:hypothetical protein
MVNYGSQFQSLCSVLTEFSGTKYDPKIQITLELILPSTFQNAGNTFTKFNTASGACLVLIDKLTLNRARLFYQRKRSHTGHPLPRQEILPQIKWPLQWNGSPLSGLTVLAAGYYSLGEETL